jgi:hypothetical protein
MLLFCIFQKQGLSIFLEQSLFFTSGVDTLFIYRVQPESHHHLYWWNRTT